MSEVSFQMALELPLNVCLSIAACIIVATTVTGSLGETDGKTQIRAERGQLNSSKICHV